MAFGEQIERLMSPWGRLGMTDLPLTNRSPRTLVNWLVCLSGPDGDLDDTVRGGRRGVTWRGDVVGGVVVGRCSREQPMK